MAGFEFRARPGNRRPTVRTFVFKNTEKLSRGDFLTYDGGQVALSATGDMALLGVCQETCQGVASKTLVQVIADSDAVYAIGDDHDRFAGEMLELTGTTGAQGVTADGHADLRVMLDSSADQETLVRINDGHQHEPLRAPQDALAGGELNAAIARAVVGYHREHMGRGPTKAHAFHRGNVLVVVLKDVMTTAERSLAEAGRDEIILEMRGAFQELLRQDLTSTIEELTGARVVAFMSGNHVDPDMASEVFVLDRPLPTRVADTPDAPA